MQDIKILNGYDESFMVALLKLLAISHIVAGNREEMPL